MDIKIFRHLLAGGAVNLVVLLSLLDLSHATTKIVDVTSFVTSSKYDASWIEWKTLRLTKTAPNQFVVTGDVTVNRNMGNEQSIEIRIVRQNNLNKDYATPIYTVKKPICEYISTDELVYPTILKYSNFPERDVCPFPKGDYSFNKLVFDIGSGVTRSIPTGEYAFGATFYDGQKDVAALEGEAVITNE